MSHHPQGNAAKLLLPVVILGMLALMTVMYFGGSSSGFWQ